MLSASLIALTLAATAIAAVRLRAAKRAVARCREWKPVRGHVVASSVREVWGDESGSPYIPVVEYGYVVDDMQYTSEMLTIGVNVRYSFRRSAERRLAKYRAGQAVQVLVDPLNPANAVLECRAPIIPVLWILLVIVWIVLLVGLGVLLTPGVDGPEPMLRLGLGAATAAPVNMPIRICENCASSMVKRKIVIERVASE